MRRALFASLLLAAAPAHAEDKPQPEASPKADNKPKADDNPKADDHPKADDKLHPGDVGRAFVSPFEAVFKHAREKAAEKAKQDDYTAAEVEKAPLPGKESGRIDGGEHDSTLRNIGQGVLLVPKVVLETTFAPIRGSLWIYEHYSLWPRYKKLAFDETNTYGVTPLLHVDSTYGATLGARFVHRNLFGAHERFVLRGAFGGQFNEHVDGQFKTGERLGKGTSFEMRGEYERRPRDPFYGIGNIDDAVEVRHRQQLKRATGTLDLLADHNFHVRMAGAITDLNYGVASEGLAIDMAYDTGSLTGWTGTRNLYGELELRYDSRRMTGSPVQQMGVLLDGFAGRVRQLEDGNDYWRYGGEIIRFQPLGPGRTLANRIHVEAVNGTLEDVAFTQLPQLGGTSLLRGYPSDRFRDRTAIAGSTEYLWDLSSFMLASVFVDAGRVYSGFDDVTLDNLRVGYGASLQIVEKRRFIAGVSAATSIDGGLFLNLVLDPVYEPEPRVRQK